ncbi:hypothetical protein VCHENC02_2853A, partial [Vibrio harveyi]
MAADIRISEYLTKTLSQL